MLISVIVPAHNEEKYVERCIRSINDSARFFGKNFKSYVEIIVVCNRCTDSTAELAEKSGARVVFNEDRCIAKVRNAGIAASKGRIIVTMDCDNRMTRGTLAEIYYMLKSGRYIGGGAPLRFERYSFPLLMNDLMCRLGFRLAGLYCGIFWAKKSVFDEIGGFADIRAMEDVQTAKLLKRLGKSRGQEYGCLKHNYLINSTRKYDDLGDWLYFRLLIENFSSMIKAAFGNSAELDKMLDKIFYDYNG